MTALFLPFTNLTFRRCLNAMAVIGTYWMSRILKRPVRPALPLALSVEPTTSCNLRCPECPSGLRSFSRPTGMLDPVLFANVLDQTSRHLLYLTLYFQGEPYLHPDFIELVRIAKRRRLFVTTSTNGHFLDDETARSTVESGLDRLIVSVDGATQETYEQYRIGGSLEKVLNGVRRVVEWKRRLHVRHPHVVFQVLVVRPNEHELDRLSAMAQEIGVDQVVFKTAQVYAPSDGHALIPSQDAYARYVRQSDGSWKIKNPLHNSCWKMWHACVMTWDGKIVPCCFDKDASHQVGDLTLQSFRDAWYSVPYQDFRSRLFKGRREIDICTNCSEGTKVFG